MVRVTALVVALLAVLLAYADDAAPAAVIGVRYSTAPEKVRVVLDLPAPATFTDRSNPLQPQISVAIPLAAPLPVLMVNDPIVTAIAVAPDANGNAQLTLTLAKPRKYEVCTLPAADGRPFRVVVDVLKLFNREETRTLSPAISYLRMERQTDDTYLSAHLVEFNATDPHIRLGTAAAQDGRERVESMVMRTGAVCGINGGYFIEGTRPVGLLKVDGAVLALPLWGRTAVAFPHGGIPVLDNPRGVWRLTLPDTTTRDLPDALDASIQTPPPTALLYNGNLLTQVPAAPSGFTALIRNNIVLTRATGPLQLAPGDLAIRLLDKDAIALDPVLTVGVAVTLTPVLTPAWDEYRYAIGGGPRLLRDGKVDVTGEQERFKPDIRLGRNARTALGITARGRVVLAVVEAPGYYGGGMTLIELAELLKARGAVNALNLDGGGSTTLALGGTTVNCAPGAWIRPLASSVLVFDDRVNNTCSPVADVQ